MTTYETYFSQASEAKQSLLGLKNDEINTVLLAVAKAAEENVAFLLAENQKDLDRMEATDPNYDRLQLTAQRIKDIATEIRNVANLANPVGELMSEKEMPNQLKITKIRVPLGVVGIIYEARPNVTFDVFSLCFKTANAVILKGGSDAEFSNVAIVKIIQQVLVNYHINPQVVTLLPVERASTEALLQAVNWVDVIIPRGSQSLIDFVRKHSKVPVIETGAGIVHTYADETADLNKLPAIVFNAKTRRPSVCNSLDCLIIHQHLLNHLPDVVAPLVDKQVIIYADEQAYQSLHVKYPENLLRKAMPEHFGTEFLSLKMAIKTVSNIEEALTHIQQHSSKHSEAIVSENETNIALFLNRVDAAAVYANASTAFTDGAQFGLGAEIGISTQKLHARGPMGLTELTSYKWIVQGKGQIRN